MWRYTPVLITGVLVYNFDITAIIIIIIMIIIEIAAQDKRPCL